LLTVTFTAAGSFSPVAIQQSKLTAISSFYTGSLLTTDRICLVEWSSESRQCLPWILHNRTRSTSYVDRNTSIRSRLIYTRDDGKVIMKGDNSTWLERGVHRPRCVSSTRTLVDAVCDPSLRSVRISSWAQYNTGLFILNLDKVPWGCGELALHLMEGSDSQSIYPATWPAYWYAYICNRT